LVTLVGPPGVGKTRLALASADALRGRFEDGIWLIELAGLAEPTLVPQAVAAGFGLGDQPGRSTEAALIAFLRDRDLMLVLDNCEHLIAACATLVSHVLGVCPGLRVLATRQSSACRAGPDGDAGRRRDSPTAGPDSRLDDEPADGGYRGR
jgi:predicted ATPase